MSKISSILFRLKHDSSYFPVQAKEDIESVIEQAVAQATREKTQVIMNLHAALSLCADNLQDEPARKYARSIAQNVTEYLVE